jgi:hypothetical protein
LLFVHRDDPWVAILSLAGEQVARHARCPGAPFARRVSQNAAKANFGEFTF